ncbi:M48 family metalloprotease [Spirosoma agri]|uniref:M48 family metalloprotease n=2 Tax=Spirosoma agri TaxID=1987381 RepID=A0A6M0IJU9_9BACT|nr:M48 family metalloprotease [Spirosoma agri]
MYSLGWTLFHALWQGFALVLSTALALHLLRNQSSVVRYRVGALALFVQLLISAGTFGWYYEPVSSILNAPAPTLPMRSFAIHWQTVSRTVPWHKQVQLFLDEHLSQFVLIYLLGVLLFGLRLTGGWLYLQHLSRTATKPVSDQWAELTNQLRSTLAIRSIIHVRESARIAVPMVVGVLKPVLLLPLGLATNLSMREIEAVLAHELAHVKRHDYAVNLLQSVMEVLYFFHPAIWWLSARVREEREHCCDDLSVQACGGNGRILAQALARIEELRLAQSNLTPSLAMALTSKRQLLLQRVRRMLGVPTRPVVSNGSLAGLTLATLLLVSASVYAVQQQPKPAKPKPRASRQHSVGNGTKFGLSDNNKVEYIIWKGQKLPASRVKRLQSQLDQVMTGKLSLDDVPQADRDILLTIIETTHSLGDGMNALNEGLGQIDYSTIVASAMDNIPLSPDGTVEGLANVNYDSIIHDAFTSLHDAQAVADTIIQGYATQTPDFDGLAMLRRQDSIADQQELNKGKVALLRAQAQSQQFTVESVERVIERIERQKSVLEQKRFLLTTNQQNTIMKSGFARTDSAQATLTKQIEAGEAGIRKIEAEIEKLNQQLISTQSELEKAEKPLRETELQIRKLGYTNYLSAWSHTGMGASAPLMRGRAQSIGPIGPVGPARLQRAGVPNLPAVPPASSKAVPARPAVPPTSPKAAPAPKQD